MTWMKPADLSDREMCRLAKANAVVHLVDGKACRLLMWPAKNTGFRNRRGNYARVTASTPERAFTVRAEQIVDVRVDG